MASNDDWGIRTFLSPVITRLHIYNINPIDLEDVLQKVENTKLLHARILEETWIGLWEEKANWYKQLAEEAEKKDNITTAKNMYMQAAQCYYAIFLINVADLKTKEDMYNKYALYYKKSISFYPTPVEYIEIPLDETTKIPCYLHLPEKSGSFPCAIVVEGLGSCKEEMNLLARPLVDRGIAALVPDLPGCGASLFKYGITCRMETLKKVFNALVNFAEQHNNIDKTKIGSVGLCMGGGYAYKMACLHRQLKFCVTLFPLFINSVDMNIIPSWMKQGEWYNFITGNAKLEEFVNEMGLDDSEHVSCPYLLIHGKHDNWMILDKAKPLYEKASGKKELIVLEQEPVFSSGVDVTHTMPVGEQLHWIKHVFADWVKEQV